MLLHHRHWVRQGARMRACMCTLHTCTLAGGEGPVGMLSHALPTYLPMHLPVHQPGAEPSRAGLPAVRVCPGRSPSRPLPTLLPAPCAAASLPCHPTTGPPSGRTKRRAPAPCRCGSWRRGAASPTARSRWAGRAHACMHTARSMPGCVHAYWLAHPSQSHPQSLSVPEGIPLVSTYLCTSCTATRD